MTGKPFSPRSCTRCGTPLIPHENARGMCMSCYKKNQRRDADWLPLRVPSLRERIFSRLMISPSGCLVWTGTADRGGYGKVTVRPRVLAVHRVMYEMFAGPIPEGMELDHLCHTRDTVCAGGNGCLHRRCASPAHLEVVTALTNTRRAFARPATRDALTPRFTVRTHGPASGHSSQYKGVTWHRQASKWQASIRTAGKSHYLGLFASEEDAARAYDAAALEAFGASIYLNRPGEMAS